MLRTIKIKNEELKAKIEELEKTNEELQKNQAFFAEQETKINYLETRVQELTNLIKIQKEKIIQDFLNILPEKELVQQLITTYLEFKKVEKQRLSSRKLERECNRIKDDLEEKLGEEFVEKIQFILTDCEMLVNYELELEERLKGKTFLIEEQKQALKQITDGSEEKENLIKEHEETDQKQREQLQATIFQENYLRNQLTKVEELTQQVQIVQPVQQN